MAWAIIPITGIRIEKKGYFSYDSWNWFVAACGVPSVLLGVWLLYFPESPKYMMECGDYDDALACFKYIYTLNTGDNPNNYPVSTSCSWNVKPFFRYLTNSWKILLITQLLVGSKDSTTAMVKIDVPKP